MRFWWHGKYPYTALILALPLFLYFYFRAGLARIHHRFSNSLYELRLA